MENEVYERDYTQLSDESLAFQQELKNSRMGEFLHNIKIQQPKVVSLKGKAAYEYFREEGDKLAKSVGGKIHAVVDYQEWTAQITLTLPLMSFYFAETKSLLALAILDTKMVSFVTAEDGKGTAVEIQVDYFEELSCGSSEESEECLLNQMKAAAEMMATGNPKLLKKWEQSELYSKEGRTSF